MEKKLVLGISSSPRKGANTDILLREALLAAGEFNNIRTEMICLRDYKMSPCISCYACCNEAASKGEADKACLFYRDDMDQLYPLLAECSGLILATPVYFGCMNAQMKMFMDRTEGLLRYGKSKYQYSLRNKVGGGITVGGNRNAGQEFTLQAIRYFYTIHDMIIVGSGDDPTPGCYLGGCGTTYPQKGFVKDAVLQDEIGLKSCRMLGKRVGELTSLLNLTK